MLIRQMFRQLLLEAERLSDCRGFTFKQARSVSLCEYLQSESYPHDEVSYWIKLDTHTHTHTHTHTQTQTPISAQP